MQTMMLSTPEVRVSVRVRSLLTGDKLLRFRVRVEVRAISRIKVITRIRLMVALQSGSRLGLVLGSGLRSSPPPSLNPPSPIAPLGSGLRFMLGSGHCSLKVALKTNLIC